MPETWVERPLRRNLRWGQWMLLVLEAVLIVAALGVTGANVSYFTNDFEYPRAPSKLVYNVVAVVITLLAFLVLLPLYFINPDWWKPWSARRAPWSLLLPHAFFFVIWIIAVGTSFWTCDDLCAPRRTSQGSVIYGGFCCSCPERLNANCAALEAMAGDSLAYYGPDVHYYQAAQALNIVLMLSFLVSMAIALFLHFSQRQSHSNGYQMGSSQAVQDQPPAYE